MPQVCPMCEAYIGEAAQPGTLCKGCMNMLLRTEQALLRDNSTEMALLNGHSSMVAARKRLHLQRAAAWLFYEKDTPLQRAIHLMKYSDQPQIGYQLGRQAAIEIQYTDFFDGIDLILPVPLHKNRMSSRGYNQSEYIARGLSEITGIPLDTTHLTREKDTPQQALQSGEDRRNNVADAFAVNHPEQLYHKHLLLVDDLITTGETAKACIRGMRPVRGATISVFALCKAR